MGAFERFGSGDQVSYERRFEQLIGNSLALEAVLQQVERVAALAGELIDKGDDRHVAQPADLEELPGLLLDALLVPLGAASSTITALSTAVKVR